MARVAWIRRGFWAAATWSVAAVVIGAPLHAEDATLIEGIYRGTIGHQEIVLELERVRGEHHGEGYNDASDTPTYPISGFYFYRRHGVSIDLKGMPMPDGSLRLREYRQVVGYEITADWRITVEGDTAKGTFCRCDLSKTPEAAQSEKVGRPRLTRFPDARVMGRINADLSAEFTYSRLWTAACLSGGQATGRFGGSYDETTTVVAFPPDILSVVVERSWYCGAVHGDSSAYALNFNLHTGRRFTLDHAFHTASGSTMGEDLASLFAKLYRRYYVKPTGPVAPEDCDVILRRIMSNQKSLTEAFSPEDATLLLSQQGLVIIPTFLYADSGCGPEVTIPYRELRPFVKEGSLLRRVVEARAGDQ